jgi:hypothetical protein
LSPLKRSAQSVDNWSNPEAAMSNAIGEESPGRPSVNRWRRFGKDLLYVNEADGHAIGWLDLKTGARVIKVPTHAELFQRAVTEWLSAHPEMSSAVMPRLDNSTGEGPPQNSRQLSSLRADVEAHRSAVANSPCDDSEPWFDLTKNLPGQSVRTQAIARQREQPVMTWVARALGVHTDERAWRMGEKGEEFVAYELAQLGDHWRVLHSIPIGDQGSDLDHLAIGPGGVFSLNTKHHFDASIWVAGNVFMVNGQRTNYLRNSRHEAQRVGKILSAACKMPVRVRGVVVVVNAGSLTIKEQPEGVDVVYRLQLRRWLQEQDLVLEQASVARIFAIARRSSTWVTRGGR